MSSSRKFLSRPRPQRRAIFAIFGLALALTVGTASAAGASRDILLDLVTHCLDAATPDYCGQCRTPRSEARCGVAEDCRGTTEVWSLDSRYVAVRDRKMCGCAAGFVHGLAIPREAVRGVEDPARPDGIWQFAWEVARTRIEAERIALAVNPARARSQDQLHVHLVRLRPGLAAELDAVAGAAVSDLAAVWRVAAGLAAERGYADYGVLVVPRATGGFRVVVSPDNPEKAYTEWQCPAAGDDLGRGR